MKIFYNGVELYEDPETGNVRCSCGVDECEYHSADYEVIS